MNGRKYCVSWQDSIVSNLFKCKQESIFHDEMVSTVPISAHTHTDMDTCAKHP